MPKVTNGDVEQLKGIDKSLLPYHKRLAMGLDTDHEVATGSADFGCPVTEGGGSMLGNRRGGSTKQTYGKGDTIKGPLK
jgi:hypothetical protein